MTHRRNLEMCEAEGRAQKEKFGECKTEGAANEKGNLWMCELGRWKLNAHDKLL